MNETNSPDVAVNQMLEELLEKKGIVNLPPEVKEETMVRMRAMLVDHINLSMINALSNELQAQARDIMNAGGADMKTKLDALIEGSGVDMGPVVQDAMMQYAQTYLNATI